MTTLIRRTAMSLFFFFLIFTCAVYATFAFAQPVTPPPIIATQDSLVTLILQAALNKHWTVLISAACVLLVGVAKQFVTQDKAPWLHTDLARWGLNLLVSTAGVLSATTMLGQPFSSDIIGKIIGTGGGISLFVEGWEDLQKWLASRKAPPAAPVVAKVGVVLLLLCGSGLAKAQAWDLTYGPSAAFSALDLSNNKSTSYAAGLGFQVSVGFLPGVSAGKTYDRVSIGALGFGYADTDKTVGASVALLVCVYWQQLACGGLGARVLSYDVVTGQYGGVFKGTAAPFLVIAGNLNLDFGKPPLPKALAAATGKSPPREVRGGTYYWSTPE